MLESALESLTENILSVITSETNVNMFNRLLQKHSENLSNVGDLSFSLDHKVWQFVKNSNIRNAFYHENLVINVTDIIAESQSCSLPIKCMKEIEGNMHLFLERPIALRTGLVEVLKNISYLSKEMGICASHIICDPVVDNSGCITSLRLQCLSKSISNLYAISASCKEQQPKIFLTSKSTNQNVGSYKVLCGAVLNVKTNSKESTISAEEFIQRRQNEMSLIAEHRYGVRSSAVSTNLKWKEFIAHLGKSAAIFELLQSKPSSAVKINFECASMGSSKGIAFILYNLARMETLLQTFKEKVEDQTYPPAPEPENIYFNLLSQEEEWNLVYNYVLGLPLLLKHCVHLTANSCEFRPHHVCSFLSCMVRTFSQYYRRVRILTEPREHLLSVLHARIHLVTVLLAVLKTCLRILGIEPPEVTANVRM